MTLRCLIAICAILMKNWDLSKWPPVSRGLLTGSRSERSPGRGEGRGRELGCNSHNHPSLNDLPPPLIMVHDARGEATPTGPPPPGAGPMTAGLCHWLCLWCAPEFGDGPQFPPAGAKQAAAATSLGCVKDKAQPDPQPFPLAPLQPPPCQHPPPASRDSGRTPLPGTRTDFLPQQIEAVNIDSLLFQGFLMPSDT